MGGVGKSSLIVQLAEVLSFEMGKRVLVIDSSFNAGSSLKLIGDLRLDRLEVEGESLSRHFKDIVEGKNHFDPNTAIQSKVSNIHIPTLDLLAAGISTKYYTDKIQKNNNGPKSFEIQEILGKISKSYDYILIDSYPSINNLNMAFLETSHYFCYISKPDSLSTYNLSEEIEEISNFAKENQLKLKTLGLILTQFDESSSHHVKIKRDLAERFKKMFSGLYFQSNSIFQGVYPHINTQQASQIFHKQEPKTVREKYSLGNMSGKSIYSTLLDITSELVKKSN